MMKLLQLLLVGAALLVGRAAPAQTAPVHVLRAAPTAPAGLRRQLARADSALAEPLQQARRTLAQARKRYAAGLPGGTHCLVMVRVLASDTSFRPVQARVIGWRNGAVQALISPAPAPTAPAKSPDLQPVSFPEAAVLDWTFVAANGREEGNFVGKYLDLTRQLERLPFR
ncbi:hypothetical protein [uncultured Hymenobacter sp.]|uniref:hypothetical protein n=1 Tax=uncultured Hymenobacter sp. TaxID=170016 RepID=UPI0035CBCB7F